MASISHRPDNSRWYGGFPVNYTLVCGLHTYGMFTLHRDMAEIASAPH
jgi:hypothetical protein